MDDDRDKLIKRLGWCVALIAIGAALQVIAFVGRLVTDLSR